MHNFGITVPSGCTSQGLVDLAEVHVCSGRSLVTVNAWHWQEAMFGGSIRCIVMAKLELIDWYFSLTGGKVFSLHQLYMPARNHCRMCFVKFGYFIVKQKYHSVMHLQD